MNMYHSAELSKSRDIKGLLSSIDIEDSVDTLHYPLGDMPVANKETIVSLLKAWLQDVLISDIDNMYPIDIEKIHYAMDKFINKNDALTLQINFKFEEESVLLVLLKVFEADRAKVLLSNVWLNKVSIVAEAVKLSETIN